MEKVCVLGLTQDSYQLIRSLVSYGAKVNVVESDPAAIEAINTGSVHVRDGMEYSFTAEVGLNVRASFDFADNLSEIDLVIICLDRLDYHQMALAVEHLAFALSKDVPVSLVLLASKTVPISHIEQFFDLERNYPHAGAVYLPANPSAKTEASTNLPLAGVLDNANKPEYFDTLAEVLPFMKNPIIVPFKDAHYLHSALESLENTLDAYVWASQGALEQAGCASVKEVIAAAFVAKSMVPPPSKPLGYGLSSTEQEEPLNAPLSRLDPEELFARLPQRLSQRQIEKLISLTEVYSKKGETVGIVGLPDWSPKEASTNISLHLIEALQNTDRIVSFCAANALSRTAGIVSASVRVEENALDILPDLKLILFMEDSPEYRSIPTYLFRHDAVVIDPWSMFSMDRLPSGVTLLQPGNGYDRAPLLMGSALETTS
ncbi:hypothetical protein E1162_13450 [Rhodobacteraceae bacterium RKSG542]|uniref:hypothetical protein n=1 Tax=Pseudovibrio flavus TaxID=2529854 RepID=UPI0012BC5A1A|nr:hypothetical protein [Pseudovibrio flavus]MTI18246.1 hypothetical protein [Pseudovibrio flavus]